MKKIISLILTVTILSTNGMVNVSKAQESQNTIYVSVNTGNDYYDGSINKPLKTIEAAKLKAREIEGNVTIEIMGGEYVFTSPFELSEADSNVTYKAYSNEKPVFKGSVSIPTEKANKIIDSEISDKLNEEIKEDVYVIDLEECGLNGRDIVNPSLANSQYGISSYKSNFNTFYIDGAPMEVAQWPNGRDYAQHLGANDNNSIIYDGNNPDRWAGAKDWWVGLWIPYDYAYYTFGGISIDAQNNLLEYVNNPVVTYEKNTYSRRWKAFNLIEELDAPGEYFIDRPNMKLYFYPGVEITNQNFELDVNLGKIVSVENARNITFNGIEFSNTNGSAIKAVDVENVDVINCTFNNIGYIALNFNGSENASTGCYKKDENGVAQLYWQYQKKNGSYDVDIKGNIFNNIGCSAIAMGGAGDVDTLTSSRNYIENNIIYNAGFKSVIHAMDIGGCGVTIRHNNISRLATGAITMLGNNHLIEYNEIYDAIKEAVDAGVIYQGGSDFYRGTVVQYNYIHDVKTDNNKSYEGLKNGLCGIYWDEGQQGMTANNNILVNIPIAFNSNYAGNFLYKYNIAVDCGSKWNLHDGDLRKWPIVSGGYAGTLAEIAEMVTNKDLYYATYPDLEEYLTKGTNPKRWTVIEKNLSVNCGENVGTQDRVYASITNNKDADMSVFVNLSIQDYRLLKSSTVSNEIPELINEDFNIDLIGIQTDSTFGDALSEFDVIYPQNNESIEHSDEYTFAWEPSFGANQYKVIVAKDKDFTQVVFEKETVQTQAVVTGLSDNTVYYWKVEAENISRELSGEWQTKDAPVKFAVGGLYNDSVAQNIPENMIEADPDCSNSDAFNKEYTALGWNFNAETKANGYNGNAYQFMADTRYNAEPTLYKVGPVGKNPEHMNGVIEAGKNYIISAWAKDISAEGVAPLEFGIAVKDANNNQKEGKIITLSKDWQQYVEIFSMPTNYPGLKFIEFGVPTTHTNLAGQGFMLDDLRVEEEIPYEIKLETDDNKITLGSEIEVNASLLNQGGKKGHLKQEFEWFVTDENRKEIMDGFQITETTNGVKVTAPFNVKSGKYVLIARSNDILKGIEIEVSNDFSDKLGVKPDNLIIKGVDCSNQNAETDKDFTRIGYNFDFDVIASGYTGNAYRFMANTTGATTAYKVGPVGKGLSHMSGDFEKGKKYVISAWVKDARTTEAVPFTEFSAAVMNDGWNNIWSGTKLTLSNKWQQYADTFTTPENYTSLKFLQFGAPTENTHMVGQGFMLDDLYVAEEVPCDIAFYGDTKIIKGETINIQAELLNQVGKKSSFSKEFQWFITDLDRKHGVDGFDIQETQNGVSISVTDNVATGKYSLVAVAGDIRKGIVIDVLSDFNDTQTPAWPENKIPDARAGLESNDSWGGGNGYYADKWKYVGNFAGKKGQSMRFTAQETGGTYVSTMGIAPFQMMVSNGSMYQNFEKDKDYVISIWVKDSKASDDIPYTKFSTLFRYINQNEESINIFTKEITLTNQWQQYADTVTLPSDFLSAGSLRIGSREENPMPGQSFMVDELYVAEEIPYSMNIKGNGTISTGESAKFEASIRNQVGAEGKLKQDFLWYALDSNRESFVDGITITENQDGTVNVLADSTVPEGDYTIVAVAEEYNFVKGFVVTVNKKTEAISTLNFERTGNDVNLVATVENAEAERILFVIAEFNGTTLEKVTSVTKGKNDANCDLTLKGVKTGNTIKAFIWNMGTLIPIDNPKNFNMSYLVE